MKQTISERIKQYIDYKGFSIMRFEKQIGAGNNSIGTSIKRNTNLTGDLLSKILNTFQDINTEWLLTGRGEMLKSKVLNNNLEPEDNFEEIQDLTDVALYDIQLSEEKLKNANKRIEILEELVESYKLEIKTLKNELSKFTKGKTIQK